MVQSHEQLLSADDLYRMPDDEYRHELVKGRLISEPPPGVRHGFVEANLCNLLCQYARRHDGVVLTGDPAFILQRSPDTVRAPDVAWIKRERYLSLEDESKYFPGAPDLAVEVLSPGNTRKAIAEKVADYLSAGTVLVWVADPKRQAVTIYKAGQAPQVLTGSDLLTAPNLVPDLAVPVSDLFAV
ncbi:MAG: Uma2 family endonuclease [Pseudomonadota bacterium]